MTAKRALVVDDSRSARISLQRLLEKYHIAVDFAESGEEALDYLKHHLADAIFMDHTMPGMDGLETVVAIKSNPRTATIPVMMYTAKEGEVYVSQARALGAIGVLPKQVQPGVLFEMLRKLGLVPADATDLPSASTPREPPAPADPGAGAPPVGVVSEHERPVERPAERAHERYLDTAPDPEYDQQALGASVQALITNVLNEQHVKLRSDILTSHRDFARQVAAEIFARERDAAASPTAELTAPPAPVPRRGGTGLLALLLALLLAGAGALYWQVRSERDGLTSEVARLGGVVRQRDAAILALRAEKTPVPPVAPATLGNHEAELVRAFEWALNQGSLVGFDELAFDDRRALELESLLGELARAGFHGRVRLASHLGEFCLAAQPDGAYRLAAPDTAIDDCARIGHPLDSSANVDDRQSTAFASFLATSRLVTASGIDVEIVAHDRDASVPVERLSGSITTAGEWNEAARRNNRVQYSIVAM